MAIVAKLILILLIAVFAWLTTRAWRLRQALIRWPGVVLAGLLTLVLLLLGVVALIGYLKLNWPQSRPVADVRRPTAPDQITRGERLGNLAT